MEALRDSPKVPGPGYEREASGHADRQLCAGRLRLARRLRVTAHVLRSQGTTVALDHMSRGWSSLSNSLERYLATAFVFFSGLILFLMSASSKNVRRKGLRAKDLGYADSQGIYGGIGLMVISLIMLIALLSGAVG